MLPFINYNFNSHLIANDSPDSVVHPRPLPIASLAHIPILVPFSTR